MSFGLSPSDVFLLLQLCNKAYQGWRDACGNYAAITGRLDAFTGLIERLEDESKRSDSLLRRKGHDYAGVRRVMRNSHETVTELFEVVTKYGSLSRSRSSNWDRILFACTDMSYLHRQLDVHITEVTAFLSTVGISALGRIEKSSRDPPAMHQAINRLAYQIRAHGDGDENMTVYVDDDPTFWRELRRELVKEGFRSDSIRQHKHSLKDYIIELHKGKSKYEKLPSRTAVPESEQLSKLRDRQGETHREQAMSDSLEHLEEEQDVEEMVKDFLGSGAFIERTEFYEQCLKDDSFFEERWKDIRYFWRTISNDLGQQEEMVRQLKDKAVSLIGHFERQQKRLRKLSKGVQVVWGMKKFMVWQDAIDGTLSVLRKQASRMSFAYIDDGSWEMDERAIFKHAKWCTTSARHEAAS